MIKNILITFLILTNLAFGVFAYIQKVAADELRLLAERSLIEAERQRILAEQNEAMARANLVEAAHQRDLAIQAEQRALTEQRNKRK
jgi:hypothetical protein